MFKRFKNKYNNPYLKYLEEEKEDTPDYLGELTSLVAQEVGRIKENMFNELVRIINVHKNINRDIEIFGEVSTKVWVRGDVYKVIKDFKVRFKGEVTNFVTDGEDIYEIEIIDKEHVLRKEFRVKYVCPLIKEIENLGKVQGE